MLIAIPEPVSFEVIKKHSLTTLDRPPRIGVTTMRMNTLVRDAKSGLAIHENVRRSCGRPPNTGMRATWPLVRVLRYARLIAESRLRAHNEETITRVFAFGDTLTLVSGEIKLMRRFPLAFRVNCLGCRVEGTCARSLY